MPWDQVVWGWSPGCRQLSGDVRPDRQGQCYQALSPGSSSSAVWSRPQRDTGVVITGPLILSGVGESLPPAFSGAPRGNQGPAADQCTANSFIDMTNVTSALTELCRQTVCIKTEEQKMQRKRLSNETTTNCSKTEGYTFGWQQPFSFRYAVSSLVR